MICVDLDVSLNSVAICAVDETGKLIREGTTLADAPSIVQYLEPWTGQVERVGLEAGPTSEWLTANLIELGLPPVNLESRQVKGGTFGHAGEDRSERQPWDRAGGESGMVQACPGQEHRQPKGADIRGCSQAIIRSIAAAWQDGFSQRLDDDAQKLCEPSLEQAEVEACRGEVALMRSPTRPLR
ncbi:hypothetical protein ABIC09_007481 [Bradyrhizobium sp. S3.12.5]